MYVVWESKCGVQEKENVCLKLNMDLKLFQELWPWVLFYYCIFFSGTTSKCCKQFERVLKTPSNFPFNGDKWKRSTADQPLVDLRVMLWSNEWFLLLNTFPEEWRESVPCFIFRRSDHIWNFGHHPSFSMSWRKTKK